jgi:hypothetical protein
MKLLFYTAAILRPRNDAPWMAGKNAFENIPNISTVVFHFSLSALRKHRVILLAKVITASPESREQSG